MCCGHSSAFRRKFELSSRGNAMRCTSRPATSSSCSSIPTLPTRPTAGGGLGRARRPGGACCFFVFYRSLLFFSRRVPFKKTHLKTICATSDAHSLLPPFLVEGWRAVVPGGEDWLAAGSAPLMVILGRGRRYACARLSRHAIFNRVSGKRNENKTNIAQGAVLMEGASRYWNFVKSNLPREYDVDLLELFSRFFTTSFELRAVDRSVFCLLCRDAAAVAGERLLRVSRTRGIQPIQGAHALLCSGGRSLWHIYRFVVQPPPLILILKRAR